MMETQHTSPRKRLPKWLRITMKTLMWIVVCVMLIPVMLYIPPVQTLLKDAACKVVKDKTGMEIEIGRFRLAFPVNIALDDVLVVPAPGDTMVKAREAIVDVKLLPLLKLDVKVKRLQLLDGYYKMVSQDSSMIMAVRAGRLDVDENSSADIRKSQITLGDAYLKDGSLQLYMNVWKKEPTPQDTASAPFLIRAGRLRLDNFDFAMSMLPTIDTLTLHAAKLDLRRAVVDLAQNKVSASRLSVDGGGFTYITPTPEYIKTHPAPVDTISAPTPPMIIEADSISINNFSALYAMKGARPQPGFDANYLEFKDVGIGLRGFYNEAATVVLPLTRLTAKERCGLHITDGSGDVRIDSTGIAIKDINIHTPYSSIKATAGVPFALMEMQPSASVDVAADVRLGWPDVDAFMPALKKYTAHIPGRKPLTVKISAGGTLQRLVLQRLDVAIAGVLGLKAKGYADNALTPKRMTAAMDFSGELVQPGLIERFAGPIGVPVPRFTISGNASADRDRYGVDVALHTSDGDLAARGNLTLGSESYNLVAQINNFNLAPYIPDVGVGRVTAHLSANGAGFNPTAPATTTHVEANVAQVHYNGRELRDINALLTLRDHDLEVKADASDPVANFRLEGFGTLRPDDYSIDASLDVVHLDLTALGIDTAANHGSGIIRIQGTASPARWLYDIDLSAQELQWQLADQSISLPQGIDVKLLSQDNHTSASIESLGTELEFDGQARLDRFVNAFTAVAGAVNKQIAARSLDVDTISNMLPRFSLRGTAAGAGLLDYALRSSGISLDTLTLNIRKDSLIRGDILALRLQNASMMLDTITLDFTQREKMLDYAAHMGNKAGTLDEFAEVNLTGYMGDNRVSAFLNQKNLQGAVGYRLGLTAALEDKNITVHFTPRKATIAYLPWTFNADNHIDYNLVTHVMDANLEASSSESSITLLTEPMADADGNQVHLKLDNIHIQDFIVSLENPVTGTVNSDLVVQYTGDVLKGGGFLGVKGLTYDNVQVGNFDMDVGAGMDFVGNSRARADLKINDRKALSLHALLKDRGDGLKPDSLSVELTQFPLSVANPFIGADVATLSGNLNGKMALTGSLNAPLLNGDIKFDDVAVYIAMMGSSLKFSDETVEVYDNVVTFNDFDIWGANKNPLTINGTVNARKFNDISLDMSLAGTNFQLIGNDKRAHSDMYGKLFLTANAQARGPLSFLDINGQVSVLSATDVTYVIPQAANVITQQQDEDVVRFVNLSDTTQVAVADTITPTMNMRINASLTLQPGMQANVLLSNNGTDRVQLTPSGSLSYFQNYMGDMRLNGQIFLGNGFARYSIPVVGQKMFTFAPESSILWNGDVLNPVLNVRATDQLRASVQQSGGNSHLVNFLITLLASGTLDNPQLKFDLSTDDDVSIQNELTAMSPDQRQTQAMNLLLYGQYAGPGTKTLSGPLTGNIYSFLASQVNSWAAKNIRGVDLTFGVDQYDRTESGRSSTTTSYSYQVSKSLFNNRFKISVGGNYDTDSSSDDVADNLFSDVSVEYILKQTNSTTMLVKIFRHSGYESILEGDVIDTGAGFVLKRRMGNLSRIFRIGRRKKKASKVVTDSVKTVTDKTDQR